MQKRVVKKLAQNSRRRNVSQKKPAKLKIKIPTNTSSESANDTKHSLVQGLDRCANLLANILDEDKSDNSSSSFTFFNNEVNNETEKYRQSKPSITLPSKVVVLPCNLNNTTTNTSKNFLDSFVDLNTDLLKSSTPDTSTNHSMSPESEHTITESTETKTPHVWVSSEFSPKSKSDPLETIRIENKNSLKSSFQLLNEQLTNMQFFIDKINQVNGSDNASLHLIIRDLSGSVHRLPNVIKSCLNESTNCTMQMLKSDHCLLVEKINCLTSQLENREKLDQKRQLDLETVKLLKGELQSQKILNKKLSEEIIQLNFDLNKQRDMNAKISVDKNRQRANVEKRATELDDEIKFIRMELSKTLGQIRPFQRKFDEYSRENRELKWMLNRSTNEIASLNQEVEKLQKESEILKNELSSHKTTIEVLAKNGDSCHNMNNIDSHQQYNNTNLSDKSVEPSEINCSSDITSSYADYSHVTESSDPSPIGVYNDSLFQKSLANLDDDINNLQNSLQSLFMSSNSL